MSDSIKHMKRSRRSFNANDVVKRSFSFMAEKRKEEQERKKAAKLFKESLNKDKIDLL